MPKFLKRLRRWRNKSGFTLIEVIVASALLGVLLIGVIGFATPVMNSVREKEQNARAVLLEEAIHNYVMSSLRYAVYVQTFSQAVPSDAQTSAGVSIPLMSKTYNGTDYPDHNGEGLQNMLDALKNNLGTEIYEIRCLGVRWLDDPKTAKKKLVLTNEYVDQTNCALDFTKTKPVFETCFYDDLYPVISFENYTTQYQLMDDSGNPEDQVDPADVKLASGLKVTTDIYLTDDCYNIYEEVRDKTLLTFSGVSYADLGNIKLDDPSYKLQPDIQMNTYTDAMLKSGTSAVYTGDNGQMYFYPDTYVYYIARKMKTTTPVTP